PPPTPPATSFDTGFPIFYDAKMAELDVHTGIEWGLGLGWRRASPASASSRFDLDLLGWYFRRRLEDAVPLRGTSLLGDLELLRGQGFPLPFEGRDKSEGGLNLSLRLGRFRLDSQLVRQDIASLVRRGFDAEVGALFHLPGLFLVGETPVGNWIRPVL